MKIELTDREIKTILDALTIRDIALKDMRVDDTYRLMIEENEALLNKFKEQLRNNHCSLSIKD